MRVYHRRSILGRVLAVLIAIPVVAYLARLTYEWLVPILPLVGGAILLIVFVWVGFRRRY
jgi:uncharacterized protein YacL